MRKLVHPPSFFLHGVCWGPGCGVGAVSGVWGLWSVETGEEEEEDISCRFITGPLSLTFCCSRVFCCRVLVCHRPSHRLWFGDAHVAIDCLFVTCAFPTRGCLSQALVIDCLFGICTLPSSVCMPYALRDRLSVCCRPWKVTSPTTPTATVRRRTLPSMTPSRMTRPPVQMQWIGRRRTGQHCRHRL